MTSWIPSSRRERLATCLHGRLEQGGRSIPVTVVALSEAGLIAEGSDLGDIDGSFGIEVAFESDGDSAWNPKASGPQYLHLFSATALRENDARMRGSITALFTEIGPASRRLLDDFLAQIRISRAARVPGGAIPRSPSPPIGRADESA